MIMVFGATGFVGRYLCINLKNKGKKVLALGRSKNVGNFFKENGVDFQYYDATDDSSFDALPTEGIECVINLAAITGKHEVPVENFFEVNTIGTYKTLEFCRKNKIKKYILASMHKLYNDIDKETISEKDHPKYRGDHTPFIISKIAAENFVEYYNKDFGMDGMIFRFTGVHGYGEFFGRLHQDGTRTKSTFEIFINKALEGETIEVWGDIYLKRDHIYVKDLIEVLEKGAESQGRKGVYNIASGHGSTVLEEAEAIADAFAVDKKSKVIYMPEKKGLQRGYVYDISKAKKDFDWEPKYKLEEMVKDYKKEMDREFFHFRK